MPKNRGRASSRAPSRVRSQAHGRPPSLIVTLRVQSAAGRAILRGESPVLDSIHVALPLRNHVCRQPGPEACPGPSSRQASPEADASSEAAAEASPQPTPRPRPHPSPPRPSVDIAAQESLGKEVRVLFLARVEETIAEVEAELELANQEHQEALDAAERDQNIHNIHQALLGQALHVAQARRIPTLVVHPSDSEAEARIKSSVADSMASMHIWSRNIRQNMTKADAAVQKMSYLSDELKNLHRKREAAMRKL